MRMNIKFPALMALLLTGVLTAGMGDARAFDAPRGDKALGEYLSAVCVGCHQLSGRASGGIPAIVGWPEARFSAAIRSYREGTREHDTMRTLVQALSEPEIEALAAYFGSLPPAN